MVNKRLVFAAMEADSNTDHLDFPNPFYSNCVGLYDKGNSNDWITDTVSIGNWQAWYGPFDVIVNINFPHLPDLPAVTVHRTITAFTLPFACGTKTVYAVGMHDDDGEALDQHLDDLLPLLRNAYLVNPNTTFLFQCFAGKSRSVAICIAFLVDVLHMPFDEALALVLKKRKVAKLRPYFFEVIRSRFK